MGIVNFVDDSQPYINALNLNEIQKANTYSTSEIKIGTWNGNDLYRKVITGSLGTGSAKNVSTGIDNSYNIVRTDGLVMTSNGSSCRPLQSYLYSGGETYFTSYIVQNGTSSKNLSIFWSSIFSDYNFIAIIEYTKN